MFEVWDIKKREACLASIWSFEDSGLPSLTKYLQNKTHATREQKPCSWLKSLLKVSSFQNSKFLAAYFYLCLYPKGDGI